MRYFRSETDGNTYRRTEYCCTEDRKPKCDEKHGEEIKYKKRNKYVCVCVCVCVCAVFFFSFQHT